VAGASDKVRVGAALADRHGLRGSGVSGLVVTRFETLFENPGSSRLRSSLAQTGSNAVPCLLVHHISVHATEGVAAPQLRPTWFTRRHAGSKRSETVEPLAADRITAVPKSSALCHVWTRASATRCVSRSLETQSIDAPTRASRNRR